MPLPLSTICEYLESVAPLDLAEEWDNVGLLLGDADASIQRVMTCLTLTPDVADEAVTRQAELVVSHHPILFRSVKSLTTKSPDGAMLLKLIQSGVTVFSPHTAFDSAIAGINQQLAALLGLGNIAPLRAGSDGATGSGRIGDLPATVSLNEFCQRVVVSLGITSTQFVGHPNSEVSRVGIACGAAGEYLQDACQAGCDLFLTGEARFHSCLEARSLGIAMVLPGHYATERFACEALATQLQRAHPELTVWSSEVEQDPLQWTGSGNR